MQDDLTLLKDAAQQAGEIALKYFRNNPKSWLKSASSSVSEADMAVDTYLKDTLLSARPAYGWLSEETADTEHRLASPRIFVADPIDGTRGFLLGKEDWCVALAVIDNGVPQAGVVHAPALNKTYTAMRGGGAYCNNERLRGGEAVKLEDLQVSGMAYEPWSIFMKCRKVAPIASLALRLARVASGELGAAFARHNSYDWDIASAHLLVEEAGGILIDAHGKTPRYNRAHLTHPALGAFSAQARIFLKSPGQPAHVS
jgi:myo-inositol-1(or 4)-monophosphatase